MFRLANEDEVALLTKMSKESFDTDKDLYNIKCGPTGYDSYEWHYNRYKASSLYVLEDDNVLIGGVVIEKKTDEIYIHRIFVSADYFRMGYGKEILAEIETNFSDFHIFKLDTPQWNYRTNAFYKKCKYKLVGELDAGDFMLNEYEKRI